MARVNGIFKITGSLQNVSFYTMKGSDKVYTRTKVGPTKRRMKVGPEFELLGSIRRNGRDAYDSHRNSAAASAAFTKCAITMCRRY